LPSQPFIRYFFAFSVNWMYNAASVIMRLFPKNAYSVMAPAALTQRNSYKAARSEKPRIETEHARSSTYGR
jgi:hypothetical protein